VWATVRQVSCLKRVNTSVMNYEDGCDGLAIVSDRKVKSSNYSERQVQARAGIG